jgi:type IV pilus assembly protein PilA
MIVVAIIGILAAIAIPAYQTYTIRAQVAEGLTLADGMKSAIWDYYSQHGTFPSSNASAGLPSPIIGSYVKSATVSAHGVTIVYGIGASAAIQNKSLLLAGASSAGSLSWTCDAASSTVASLYLPSSCN